MCWGGKDTSCLNNTLFQIYACSKWSGWYTLHDALAFMHLYICTPRAIGGPCKEVNLHSRFLMLYNVSVIAALCILRLGIELTIRKLPVQISYLAWFGNLLLLSLSSTFAIWKQSYWDPLQVCSKDYIICEALWILKSVVQMVKWCFFYLFRKHVCRLCRPALIIIYPRSYHLQGEGKFAGRHSGKAERTFAELG